MKFLLHVKHNELLQLLYDLLYGNNVVSNIVDKLFALLYLFDGVAIVGIYILIYKKKTINQILI